MENSKAFSAIVFVDPQCPFAWITAQWLREVERRSGLDVRVELMSLACVNEGRDLDDWYREYNEQAWRPARVAAALLASPAADRWPDFYARFGTRRHVDGLRDNAANLTATLSELGLPDSLYQAAEDPAWDDDLRARTRPAVDPSGSDGGTPMIHTAGRAFFGPVLTAIPRAHEAVQIWDAVSTLAGSAKFAEISGDRAEELQTA